MCIQNEMVDSQHGMQHQVSNNHLISNKEEHEPTGECSHNFIWVLPNFSECFYNSLYFSSKFPLILLGLNWSHDLIVVIHSLMLSAHSALWKYPDG